jgi:hypothetical protein
MEDYRSASEIGWRLANSAAMFIHIPLQINGSFCSLQEWEYSCKF